MALAEDGDFLLRIEDLDPSRCRPEWEAQIADDLAWLGLTWPSPVLRQSERNSAYGEALDALWQRDRLYPCRCSRRDIAQAASAPQEGAPILGPDGVVYPGTCRIAHASTLGPRPEGETLRLNMEFAAFGLEPRHAVLPGVFHFRETGVGPNGETGMIEFSARDVIEQIGDVVVARRDMLASYHLSVVLDDAAQNVSHVIRGQDLFEATKIHVILQNLLGLPTPVYHHHRLIRDEAGKRLAKRDDARAIARFREDGASPQDIRAMVGLG